MHRRSLLLVASLVLATHVPAQLPAGTYTIDPALPAGGTNFQTWAAATAALASGVVGPGNVLFLVASTTFVETVSIPTITGTSATTTVTFVAAGPAAVIDANGAQDAFTLLNAQSYVTVENLELRNFTRYGLNLFGTSALRCTFCTFRRITADGPATTSTTVFALRAYYGQDCVFEDCRFLGGGYTSRSEQIVRNTFRRCEFDGKGSATRVLAPYNNNDADNRWENCFFHDSGPTGNGLHIDVSSYGNMFWHNTVIVNTSGSAVFLGSLTSWSRANSFRNNIVVNLGTGRCMTYGASSTTGVLECNDLDYNVYYAPASSTTIAMQGGGFAAGGTLAAWRTFFAANPQIVPAAGGTDWDTNSIEIDPALVSAVAPYDIHLAAGSPCRDAGTTLYVAGPWITYPAGSFVADDFEQDPRPAAGVDIGADEAPVCLIPEYETNSPGSNLDVDGVQGTPCQPAVTVQSQGAAGLANFASTNVGLGFEAVIAAAPLISVSGGALVTANLQFLNVNVAAPALLFLNGGAVPNFLVPFPGAFSVGYTAPQGPFVLSIQMANIDPGHPDLISISQGCQLNVP